MKLRISVGLALLLGFAAACSIPLSPSAAQARVAFQLSVPNAASFSGAGGRLVAAETVLLRVTVQTPSKADEVLSFSPTAAQVGSQTISVALTTTVGTHNFVFEAFGADGKLLTVAEKTAVLVKGTNALSVTLLPPTVLALGSNPVSAGVNYFTVPLLPGLALTFEGAGSLFWETASTGVFTGTGAAGTFTLDPPPGGDRYLRVEQSPSGTIDVYQPTVANVAFSQPGGSSSVDLAISLSTSTPGASIAYKLNGVGPVSYTGPIAVAGDGADVTIEASATRAGFIGSTTKSENYQINYNQVSDVTFNPPGGTYAEDQSVTLSVTTPGASIEYSTDNGGSYTAYTAGDVILVKDNGTTMSILARAYASGMVTSTAVNQDYTIQYPAIVITFALPEEPPVITGPGAGVQLNRAEEEVLQVQIANQGFDQYLWFIDGHTDYYDGSDPQADYDVADGKSLLLESKYMTLGKHEIMVLVTDETGAYSASFQVEVIE